MKKKIITSLLIALSAVSLVACNRTHKLDAPKITQDGNSIIWEAVENATSYVVTENDTTQAAQTGLKYTISTTEPGEYKLFVVAKASGYEDSNKSNTITYKIPEKLAMPNELMFSKGVVTFKEVKGAIGYDVYLNGVRIERVKEPMLSLSLTDGINKIEVQAIALDGKNIDSDKASLSIKAKTVKTTSELIEAMAISDVIILENDIEPTNDDNMLILQSFTTKMVSLNKTVVDQKMDYKFELDLNGNDLKRNLTFVSYYISSNDSTLNQTAGTFDVKVYDSSDSNGIIGYTEEGTNSGLMFQLGEGSRVDLDGINATGYNSGMYSNGLTEGAVIVATNCNFTGFGINSSGGFFSANYSYTFANCNFSGGDGIYAKSGTFVFNNCKFHGNNAYLVPTYNPSGSNPTGNAFTVDSAAGYQQTLNIAINDALFESVNGYGLQEVSTAISEDAKVSFASVILSGKLIFEVAKDETVSENGVVQIIKD